MTASNATTVAKILADLTKTNKYFC